MVVANCLELMDHRRALDLTFDRFGIKAADIARKAGIGANELSRYRRGHTDFLAARAFQIIRAMPLHAQFYYWDLCIHDDSDID